MGSEEGSFKRDFRKFQSSLPLLTSIPHFHSSLLYDILFLMQAMLKKFWLGDPNDPSHVQMTRFTYLLSYILYTPFWGIYNMLPFILYKDLHATPWQIAMMITLKPVVSIFSLYWSSHVSQRPDRLKKNIVIAGI